jgi:transcriptional regulator with XRE-family HTH domain
MKPKPTRIKQTKTVWRVIYVEPIYAAIGANIKAEREKAGITQEDFAKKLKMTRTWLTNVEHGGRQRVHIHTLAEIAKALGIDQRRLYRGVL